MGRAARARRHYVVYSRAMASDNAGYLRSFQPDEYGGSAGWGQPFLAKRFTLDEAIAIALVVRDHVGVDGAASVVDLNKPRYRLAW